MSTITVSVDDVVLWTATGYLPEIKDETVSAQIIEGRWTFPCATGHVHLLAKRGAVLKIRQQKPARWNLGPPQVKP